MQPLRPLLRRPHAAAQSCSLRRRSRQPDTGAASAIISTPQAQTPRCFSTNRVELARRIVRPVWKMRPGVPLFEIPMSLLDLDAENNPDVRPYNEEVDGEPETEKWKAAHASIDALSERLAEFGQEIRVSKARMLATAYRPTPWRILDRDIWSAVLLGGSRSTNASEAAVMAEVLFQNGISPRLAFQQIPLMLQQEKLGREEGIHEVSDRFMLSLKGCHSPLAVRRLIALTVQTPIGPRVAMLCSKSISRRLAYFVERAVAAEQGKPEATPVSENQTESENEIAVASVVDTARQVSEILLNLSYALASETELKRTAMWAVGLWAAALAGETGAVRRFLQAGIGEGGTVDVGRFLGAWTTKAAEEAASEPAPVLALSIILQSLRSSTGSTTAAFKGSRAELFTLLTGVTLLRPPTAPEAPEASFRALFTRQRARPMPVVQPETRGILLPSVAAYGDLYIAMLAELGGVRTIWEQQHQQLHQQQFQDQYKIKGAIVGAIDTDTLVTAVLRYATYTEISASTASTAGTAPTVETATTAMTKASGNSSVWDLYTIATYEAATATARQAPSLFPTLRAVPDVTEEEETPRTIVVDDAFRAQVVEAFSKESADKAVQAIDALLLARRGE